MEVYVVIKTREIDLNFFTVFYLSNLTELVSCSHTVNLKVVLYMAHILVLLLNIDLICLVLGYGWHKYVFIFVSVLIL